MTNGQRVAHCVAAMFLLGFCFYWAGYGIWAGNWGIVFGMFVASIPASQVLRDHMPKLMEGAA